MVFIFMLAMSLYSTVLAILLSVLSLLPCIGLIVLWRMSAKATRTLTEAGYDVGFLGANLADFR